MGPPTIFWFIVVVALIWCMPLSIRCQEPFPFGNQLTMIINCPYYVERWCARVGLKYTGNKDKIEKFTRKQLCSTEQPDKHNTKFEFGDLGGFEPMDYEVNAYISHNCSPIGGVYCHVLEPMTLFYNSHTKITFQAGSTTVGWCRFNGTSRILEI